MLQRASTNTLDMSEKNTLGNKIENMKKNQMEKNEN